MVGSADRRREKVVALPGSLARSRGTRGRAQWCRPRRLRLPRRRPAALQQDQRWRGPVCGLGPAAPDTVPHRSPAPEAPALPSPCPRRLEMLELRRAGRRSRPVTGGKRHSFIEKEQLGPAAPAHQLPAASLIVEDTNEPRLGRPAPAKQRFGCGVVDDPAVAGVKASLRDRDDIAKRGHPVLQRSPISSSSSREGFSGCRLPVCPHVLRDQQRAAGADLASIRQNLPRRPSPAALSQPSTISTATQSGCPAATARRAPCGRQKAARAVAKRRSSMATGSASKRTVLTEESCQTGTPASPRSQ
jgi:hypothetical protein